MTLSRTSLPKKTQKKSNTEMTLYPSLPSLSVTGLPAVVLADLVAESKRAQSFRLHRDQAEAAFRNALGSTALARYPEELALRAFRWSWIAARRGIANVSWESIQ